jgi:uncharacterized protein
MITKENLTSVIKSQREWISTIDKGIERRELRELKLKDSFALVISGIRRCGKSTLLNQVLSNQKKFYYLNLEDPRLEGFELSDFNKADNLLKELYGSGGIYFFDEIQNIEKWEKFIRFLVDKKNKVMITGSNASLLSRELGTRLTGRHISSELFPFSYLEFLKFFNQKPSEKTYSDYLYKGGFPEYLKDNDITLLHELLKDVLMRDIVNRFGIKNIAILKKLAIYLLTNVGKEFSYSSIQKMLEIKAVQTVIDYISYMEDSYLIFTIPKFSYSYKKQQVNPKKVYSIDNGLSSANSASFSKDKGKMLENNVFINLRRKYKEIFYYQNKGECDFVVKDREKVILAIQVCYEFNDENQKRELNGLIEAMDELKLEDGLILTYNQQDKLEVEGKKIILKPVWKWLLEDQI